MSEQRTHNRPAPTVVSDTSADTEAWKVACVARKYELRDGLPVCGGGGLLFTVPAIPGFASLPESVRPGLAQAWLQYVTNRVGQTAEGNVQDAVNKATTDGAVPGANSNNALERHFLNRVAERVAEVIGDLPEKATKEQKDEREAVVLQTAAKFRAERYDLYIGEGFANAKTRPVTDKKKRVAKAADTSAAVAI